jgi:hypothetical protein
VVVEEEVIGEMLIHHQLCKPGGQDKQFNHKRGSPSKIRSCFTTHLFSYILQFLGAFLLCKSTASSLLIF